MPKFKVRIPVTAWMDVGEVEADDFDDAMDKAYEHQAKYPELCEICVKKFDLEEPDETGIEVFEEDCSAEE